MMETFKGETCQIHYLKDASGTLIVSEGGEDNPTDEGTSVSFRDLADFVDLIRGRRVEDFQKHLSSTGGEIIPTVMHKIVQTRDQKGWTACGLIAARSVVESPPVDADVNCPECLNTMRVAP